jgi:hypothetical protein
VVAHTRKTPSAGSIRSMTSRAENAKAENSQAAKPADPKTTPAAPGAVNKSVQSVQSVQFRSLNVPVPIDVVENTSERPVSVTLPPSSSSRSTRSRRLASEPQTLALTSLAVTAINDLWQVDDEWWRERPISRRYYQITTLNPLSQDERRLTIFRDQLNAQWYWQKGG